MKIPIDILTAFSPSPDLTEKLSSIKPGKPLTNFLEGSRKASRKRAKSTEAEIIAAHKLRQQGLTPKEISAQTDIPLKRLCAYLSGNTHRDLYEKYGVPVAKRKHHYREDAELIWQHRLQGKNVAEISAETELDKQFVWKTLRGDAYPALFEEHSPNLAPTKTKRVSEEISQVIVAAHLEYPDLPATQLAKKLSLPYKKVQRTLKKHYDSQA